MENGTQPDKMDISTFINYALVYELCRHKVFTLFAVTTAYGTGILYEQISI